MSSSVYIFDFDGTIADSAQLVLEIGNVVLKNNKREPITELDFNVLKDMSVKEQIQKMNIPVWMIPKLAASVRSELKARIDQLEPIQGMPELLKELSSKSNTRVALLSSNSKDNIEYFLNKHALSDIFEYKHTDVGIFSKKNRLQKLVKTMGCKPNDVVVYVGDESRDVEAALKAGLVPVSVTWGLNSIDLLKR